MPKVALSGAGGQLGRFLRPALLDKGVDLRSAGGRTPLDKLNPQEDVMHGDLRDPAVADRLLEGVDILIHLAGTSVELSVNWRLFWSVGSSGSRAPCSSWAMASAIARALWRRSAWARPWVQAAPV